MAAVPSIGRAAAVRVPPAPAAADTTHALYERYGQQINRFCFQRLRNREEAEDATQTTFLNAFRGLERGASVEFESAWLYKIALNVCLTKQRSSHRRRLVEAPSDFKLIDDLLPSPEPDTDELFGLDVALRLMPEQQRRAFLLREWQGLSYKEIAEEMRLSQSAVETLLFRARRSLAEALTQAPNERRGRGRPRKLTNFSSTAAFVKTLFLGGGAKVAATVAAVAATSVVAATPAVRHQLIDAVLKKPVPPRHTTPAPTRPAEQAQLAATAPQRAPTLAEGALRVSYARLAIWKRASEPRPALVSPAPPPSLARNHAAAAATALAAATQSVPTGTATVAAPTPPVDQSASSDTTTGAAQPESAAPTGQATATSPAATVGAVTPAVPPPAASTSATTSPSVPGPSTAQSPKKDPVSFAPAPASIQPGQTTIAGQAAAAAQPVTSTSLPPGQAKKSGDQSSPAGGRQTAESSQGSKDSKKDPGSFSPPATQTTRANATNAAFAPAAAVSAATPSPSVQGTSGQSPQAAAALPAPGAATTATPIVPTAQPGSASLPASAAQQPAPAAPTPAPSASPAPSYVPPVQAKQDGGDSQAGNGNGRGKGKDR